MIIPKILEVQTPDKPLPLIFDSPHSGTVLPDDFNYICTRKCLTRAEDRFVDDLFSDAPKHGGTLLCALFPRTYIDVNRAVDDIDPELIAPDDLKNWPYDDITINPTKRSYAGIGLIRRLITPNEHVYKAYLSPKDIKSRIETYYKPYHDTLSHLIDDAHATHGQVWHINCHSMPSPSLTSGALRRVNPFNAPDFVLGDRDGTTCDIGFTHAIRDYLKKLGYKVAINDPYKGVELVERYSNPADNRYSLQIEINRALYLNENTFKESKNYVKLKADITKLIVFCEEYIKTNL